MAWAAWAWARVMENITAWASTRKTTRKVPTMAWAKNIITGTIVVSAGNTVQFILALPKLA